MLILVWGNLIAHTNVTWEGGKYYIQVYLSFIQHKGFEMTCNLYVLFTFESTMVIIPKDPE